MPEQPVADFISKSKSDPELSSRIMAIFETHGSAAAKEILQLAHDEGFKFSQAELEATVRAGISKQFGGDPRPEALPSDEPPESACSRGCLSYTHNWHPDPIFR